MSTQGNTSWPKRRAVDATQPKKASNKRRIILISSILGVLLLGGFWGAIAMGMFSPTRDSLMAKLRDPNVSEDEKDALREKLFASGRRNMGRDDAEMAKRERDLLTGPHDVLIAAIDKEVDREAAREADRAKRQAERDAKKAADGTTDPAAAAAAPPGDNSGQGGQGAGGPPGSKRGPKTEADRVAAQHRRLTSTNGQDRDTHTQYRELVRARAAQRGVNVGGGGGGGYGR